MRKECLLLTFFLALPACAEPPPPAHPVAENTAAKEKHAKFERKLEAAKKALAGDDANKARELAGEARGLADLDDMVVVLAFFGEIDRYLAEGAAEPVQQQAARGECQAAMETVAAATKETPHREFIKALFKQTEVAVVRCLQKDIEQAAASGKFESVSATLDLPATKEALRPEALQGISEKLRNAVVEHVSRQIQTEIKAGKYDAAAAKVAEAVSRGVLDADSEEKTLTTIRDAAAPRQLEAVTLAIGLKKKADAPLAELDALVKTLKWSTLPPNLAKARGALAVWVECLKLKCTLPKPEAKFAYGKLELHPGDASSAPPATHLPNAKKVWVLARAGKLALLATEETAAEVDLKARLQAAVGWGSADQLKKDDTAEWLPPGEELKDQRVFGPLRDEKQKIYHLGFVMAVEGADVRVKRFADDQVVTVARSTLRIGRLPKGLKVLTSCPGKTEQTLARVDHEVPPQPRGTPLVNVVCLKEDGSDGPAHDEFLGAIAVQREWLPPPKP